MYTIFDFDSTIITIEWLDTLARIALEKQENSEKIMQHINDITHMGMSGQMPFKTALDKRIKLLNADKNDIIHTQKIVMNSISPSFSRYRSLIEKNNEHIYIVSWWFDEFVFPVADFFGISHDHVFANRFVLDTDDKIIWVDTNRLLSQNQGKANAVAALQLDWPITVVWDGFTDYEIKKMWFADIFVAYAETVSRDSIVWLADYVAYSFEDLSHFFS
jgi:D-3-phosphoglycerate dehydrogenase / 2-oxoglutarate reductase